ncbi:hypothetical protein [Arthrobacter sp. M2012083]|uniref:MmyB family transcriptional regulator n=1 Tax=Arthrobacter sp. M2012083 TaxID=1197706 RepID=UPI00178C82BB
MPKKPGDSRLDLVLSQLLGKLTYTPAILIDEIGDIVASNALGRELFSEYVIRDNLPRMVFLDASAQLNDQLWRANAQNTLGRMRSVLVRGEAKTRLSLLLDSLLMQSLPFRRLWLARQWGPGDTPMRVFRHHEMGEIVVEEVQMTSAADPSYTVVAYVPRPGSVSEESIRLLSSLTAGWGITAGLG